MKKCSKCGLNISTAFCPDCGGAAETLLDPEPKNSFTEVNPIPNEQIRSGKGNLAIYVTLGVIFLLLVGIFALNGYSTSNSSKQDSQSSAKMLAESYVKNTPARLQDSTPWLDQQAFKLATSSYQNLVDNLKNGDDDYLNTNMKNLRYALKQEYLAEEAATQQALNGNGAQVSNDSSNADAGTAEGWVNDSPSDTNASGSFPTVRVPNFIGYTQREAETLGLQIGLGISTKYTTGDPLTGCRVLGEGPVLAQDRAAGTVVSTDRRLPESQVMINVDCSR